MSIDQKVMKVWEEVKFYKEMMMMVLMMIDFDYYPLELWALQWDDANDCSKVHNADDGCIP